MTISKKSKKASKAFVKWRREHGITHCQNPNCDKKLTKEKHHYLCNECWSHQQQFKHLSRKNIFKDEW